MLRNHKFLVRKNNLLTSPEDLLINFSTQNFQYHHSLDFYLRCLSVKCFQPLAGLQGDKWKMDDETKNIPGQENWVVDEQDEELYNSSDEKGICQYPKIYRM